MVFGLGCWWSTETLQRDLTILQGDQTARAQTLLQLQKKLATLVGLEEQKKMLMKSLESMNGKTESVHNSADVLDGIGRSVENLQIWLEKVQIEHGAVEIQGRSFSVEDVGKCLDRLESILPFQGISQVEIHDYAQEAPANFSFFIRFSIHGNQRA